MQLDKRYNRIIMPNSRVPWADLGARGVGKVKHDGFIKCKLAHGRGYSIFIPDLLFLGPAAEQWIQPLSFGPNVCEKYLDDVSCSFSVDISCGHRLLVEFNNKDLKAQFADGSEFYKCRLQGPADLVDYATGQSGINEEGTPWVRLYHHTSIDSKKKIEASRELWASNWNIQGTHKKLINVGYVYLTPVDAISHADDLKLIAMASDGKLSLIVDGFEPPAYLLPGWQDKYKNKILVLPVYRASTQGRTETLSFDVETTLLSPQHILRHAPPYDFVWYEIAAPFVHRIGLQPGVHLAISKDIIRFDRVKPRQFEYVVVGDATTVDGLAAPYDEENTSHMLKLERPQKSRSLCDFWFEHGNTDQYSVKDPEQQSFSQVVPPPQSDEEGVS